MADPMGLVVADAAAHAVEFVGLPEAQLNLAQAVVHLATAPKSNRVGRRHLAGRATTCSKGVGGEVPVHLRDAHYRAATSLGHGEGYEYPHDDPRGWVRPAVPARRRRATRRYYEPSRHGYEQEIAERMRRLADGAEGADRTDDEGSGP